MGRVLARRLDPSRPLWEIYLVEGMEDGSFALVSKTHLALVDGIDGGGSRAGAAGRRSSSSGDLDHSVGTTTRAWVAGSRRGALWESAKDPGKAIENLQGAITSALGIAMAIGEAVGGIGGAFGELAGEALRGKRPAADSPLAGDVSEQRRVALLQCRWPG